MSQSNFFLGDLAEISLAVSSLTDTTPVFKALGFQEVEPLELPYNTAAFTDGEIRFSLHEANFSSPTITFFGSEIAAIQPVIEERARAVQELQRESGAATALSCRIPDNWRMVVASQQPPQASTPIEQSRCGAFVELALPTNSMEDSVDFWAHAGFQPQGGSEAPYRYAHLHDGTLSLGLHETTDFDQPACFFRTRDMQTLLTDLPTGVHILRQSRMHAAISLPGDLLFILSAS